jgi:hypothetical protein
MSNGIIPFPGLATALAPRDDHHASSSVVCSSALNLPGHSLRKRATEAGARG